MPKRTEALNKIIKKQEFDFTTIREIVHQLNTHAFEFSALESYINYLVNTIRGHLGVGKVCLVRPDNIHSPRLVLRSDNKKRLLLEFSNHGSFGK